MFQKSHEEVDKLRDEISVRDEKIKALIKELEKLQQEIAVTHHTQEKSQERLLVAREESNVSVQTVTYDIRAFLSITVDDNSSCSLNILTNMYFIIIAFTDET